MTEAYPYIGAAMRAVIVVGMILAIIPVMVWMERKGAAYIQDRRGPNRASIQGVRLGGLIHSLADALKLLTKNDITGARTSRFLFALAPIIALSVPLLVVAVLPLAQSVEAFGYEFSLQVANPRGGLMYVVALSALGVYALLIGGWASFGKYSFLGALRASAQTISYALAMGLAAAAVFAVTGSFGLNEIVADQGIQPWTWNCVRQPVAFLIFVIALFAECNRLPFDLPEAESELVAGYHTEYSSMRFALFYMGEYAHIVVGSLVVATVFLGGWQVPFVGAEAMRANIDATVAAAGSAAALVLILLGAFMILRFKRRYGDARDFEVLVWGIPCFALGMASAGAAGYIHFGPSTLVPDAASLVVFGLQLIVVLAKTMVCASIFIWVRWTLPRFRYDQLMYLGWKVLLPLGLANLLLTALAMLMV